jgi:hypothetical protein
MKHVAGPEASTIQKLKYLLNIDDHRYTCKQVQIESCEATILYRLKTLLPPFLLFTLRSTSLLATHFQLAFVLERSLLLLLLCT